MGHLKVLCWTPGLMGDGGGGGDGRVDGHDGGVDERSVPLSITGCSINFIKAPVPADIN